MLQFGLDVWRNQTNCSEQGQIQGLVRGRPLFRSIAKLGRRICLLEGQQGSTSTQCVPGQCALNVHVCALPLLSAGLRRGRCAQVPSHPRLCSIRCLIDKTVIIPSLSEGVAKRAHGNYFHQNALFLCVKVTETLSCDREKGVHLRCVVCLRLRMSHAT